MAINCIQGTPGSGKSAFAVSRILDHLRRGGVVAANFSLVDGWADTVANRSFEVKYRRQDPYEYAKGLYDRFRVIGSLDGVYEATKDLIPKTTGKISKEFEGHGLLVIDEAQLIFNSRAWQKNFPWIEFFSQHRKHKWDVLLITHSIDMIDSQVRCFVEFDVRFRNLNKVRLPVIKIRASSLFLCSNVFLSIWRYYGISAGSGTKFKTDIDRLLLWEAQLYDSMRIFSDQLKIPDYAPAGPAPVPRVQGQRSCPQALKNALQDLAEFGKAEDPATWLPNNYFKKVPNHAEK